MGAPRGLPEGVEWFWAEAACGKVPFVWDDGDGSGQGTLAPDEGDYPQWLAPDDDDRAAYLVNVLRAARDL